MDFVSAHRGAIPASAMTAEGQFTHPIVVRAKVEIAAACHAFGKTPSHSVVTEFSDAEVVAEAARRAAREFAFTRMWSIQSQPDPADRRGVRSRRARGRRGRAIIDAAADAGWAPIRHGGVLHDRASYRYWWRIVVRAQRTGLALPADFRQRFFADSGPVTRGRVAERDASPAPTVTGGNPDARPAVAEPQWRPRVTQPGGRFMFTRHAVFALALAAAGSLALPLPHRPQTPAKSTSPRRRRRPRRRRSRW